MCENEKQSIVAGESKINALPMTPEYYGPFWKYVNDDRVTDIDFNGTDLWITDTTNRRIKVKNHGITKEFVDGFAQRVSNHVSKPFNKLNNLLEAETETLRISMLHESAAVSGRSVCLRKTLPMVRITAKGMIADNYCPRPIINLLVNCVQAHLNFIIGGIPGAGKTELAKFLAQFIPGEERVITIEDSPEWHYREINPGKDCVEMRVNEEFPYPKAIKTCLRQNPKWIMLSEARSIEAKYLLESWSTGTNGITTIHTDDIRKIPSRFLNMMASRDDADRLENDVYEFANVVLTVRRKSMPDGTAHRYIDQMGFLYREGKENKIIMLLKNGEVICDEVPADILFKLNRAEVQAPFESKVIDNLIDKKRFTYTYLPKPEPVEEEPVKEEAPVVQPLISDQQMMQNFIAMMMGQQMAQKESEESSEESEEENTDVQGEPSEEPVPMTRQQAPQPVKAAVQLADKPLDSDEKPKPRLQKSFLR